MIQASTSQLGHVLESPSDSAGRCETGDMRVQGPRHVALTVRNLEVSRRWYSDIFSLEEVRREVDGDRHAIVLAAPDGSMTIGLVQHGGAPVDRFDPTVIGLDHAGWSVATRAELSAWEALLNARGVEHSAIADAGPLPS